MGLFLLHRKEFPMQWKMRSGDHSNKLKEKSEMNTKEEVRKKQKWWRVAAVAGILLLVLSVAALIWGMLDRVEDGTPEDLYYAEESQQYVYVPVQYMSEAFGSYESYGKMSLYFAFNEDWEPYIICMDDADAAQYADLVAYTYGMLDEAQPQNITGYAAPLDDEIRNLAIECYNELFDEEYAAVDNFTDLFGSYYMQVGAKSTAYTNFNTFIILLVSGGALSAFSFYQVRKYRKILQKAETAAATRQFGEEGVSYGMTDMFSEQSVKVPGEVVSHNRLLGVLGAIGGALIGSALIIVLGMLGYVSGWAAVAMALLAINGYKWLAKGIDKAGIVLSIVITALMVIGANFLEFAIVYYQHLNEIMGGYVSFWRALQNTTQFMTDYDAWGTFWQNVAMGYLLGGVCLGFWVPGIIRSKKSAAVPANYQPQNIYSEPDEFGEQQMSVTLKLPKSNAVILYIMGGLMVLFGLFLGLALLGNESVAGAVTIFLFFVFWTVVLIWLGKISSGVTYTADECGVHWYRPFGKKHVDIAYAEITKLELSRIQCRVFTGDPKKKIFIALRNFKNAQDFAYVVQTCYNRVQERAGEI